MSETPIHKQLSNIQKLQTKLDLKKDLLIEKAFTHSEDPEDLLKANEVFNVNQRHPNNRKSYLFDPYEFQSFLGYKDRPYSLTYSMLKRISYAVPIIRAIISTRIDQVSTFCEPQQDKYSTGFIVRKKKNYFYNDKDDDKLTEEDKNTIQKITEFILNCGVNNNFEGDDFDTFVRKIINDSLTYDQMTFEVVSDRKGRPLEFYAVDASTMRIADSNDTNSYDKEDNQDNKIKNRHKVAGYYPSYCQVDNGLISADFYAWEMCFGVRNATTNIYAGGYGVSEIEMLMQVITSMIWGDEYNRRFFSQGSSPKGFFKVKEGTSISDGKLAQFKQQYQAMAAGVQNSHKTAVLQGDIEWVDLQHTNRDMEYSHWQEYLIKLACAIYRIDPSEIGFHLSGNGDAKPMFEGNNEARLKESKDKGLYPLLKFLERKINKYIVKRINPGFEFVFAGLQIETPSEELDNDIKMLSNFMTLDELRIKRGLKPLGDENGGSIILNSVLNQALAQKQQTEQQQQQGQEEMGRMDTDNPEDQQNDEEQEEENPFEKSLNEYLATLA